MGMTERQGRLNRLKQGVELFRKLSFYAETRRKELVSQLQPVIDLADSYGSLVARAVFALGKVPPKSRQEVVVRDLIADVFDFLYEWPRPLFEGRLHVAFPLARRVYESLSLLSACYQNVSIAERWDRGEQIGNSEIRKALKGMPFPEAEEALREIYKFFSKGTHPNRDLISERFLGEGNEFVLGSIGRPNLLLVVEHCIRLVEMWFWFGAIVAWVAKETLSQADPSFGKEYLITAERAPGIKRSLSENFNRLLQEVQAELDKRRPTINFNGPVPRRGPRR
jgi:hypothetical protein